MRPSLLPPFLALLGLSAACEGGGDGDGRPPVDVDGKGGGDLPEEEAEPPYAAGEVDLELAPREPAEGDEPAPPEEDG